ncbi:phosphotransferase [Devosia sp. FKR38]|uniref:phosphotransferase n=1 Tax=Devosia sp. FKR38 TaxID=2562312 RepID=UPI0020C05FA6|nr:phosphotransferase [Devosia sp. FKR38]
MVTAADGPEEQLVGGRSTVTRQGDVVFRQAAPWSKTTMELLRHLEAVSYAHAPRVIGSGFDAQSREVLSFVEGESPHPYAWDDAALPVLGAMLRDLHQATAGFVPDQPAVWRPWFGRSMGVPSVIGHCDTGAWNIIARDGLPVALIDWEAAGPVDPLIELAQACWLNGLLFDDDLAETLGLGSVEARARQVRLLLDGYELPPRQRVGFVGLMRDFAIACAANEAIEAGISPDTVDAGPLWAITWRVRSAGWLVRHHDAIERVVLA